MGAPRLLLLLAPLALFAQVVCLEWWKTAIVYQIYPKSFKDSDGTGIGDLQGIIEKLDYLKDIGVTAIWMSPIFKSPMADNGYDISDFRDIDPMFGTMDDFNELLDSAHDKDIKVILDFVPNHSSDEHEWFVASSDPTDPRYEQYKDYYVWVDPNDDDSLPNKWPGGFNEPSAWEWVEARNQYYLHQFLYKQPDLNYRNPAVLEDMKDVLRFWLDKGVDGFRMDAVSCIVEEEGFPDFEDGKPNPMQHQPETYEVIQEFRKVLDEYDDRVMMTEAYGSLEQVLGYYGNKTNPGAHFSFNFLLITDLGSSSTAEDFVRVIEGWIDVVNENEVWSNWVVGNHDQHRAASRYNAELVDGLNMLVTLLPGTAVTYNGEEIGMEDNYDMSCEVAHDPQGCADGVTLGNSRDPERTPFQWDDSENAGFSTAEETWLPVNANYLTLNAAAQNSTAGGSHLKTYRRLAQLRRDDESLHTSNATVASSGSVFVFSRSSDGVATTVVAMNVGSEEETVDLVATLSDVSANQNLTVYVASVNSGVDEGSEVNGTALRIPAQQAVVLRAPPGDGGSGAGQLAASLGLLVSKELLQD